MLSIGEKSTLDHTETQLSSASIDKTEQLRQILSKQAHRQIDYDVAQEIGSSLIEYYEILNEEVDDEQPS